MAEKKPASKSKGAKSLSADKASQVKGGVSLGLTQPPDPTVKLMGDGSVKTISGIKQIGWK